MQRAYLWGRCHRRDLIAPEISSESRTFPRSARSTEKAEAVARRVAKTANFIVDVLFDILLREYGLER